MLPTSVHISTVLRLCAVAYRTLVLQNIWQQMIVIVLLVCLMSCSSTKKIYKPEKKFSPLQLLQDYQLFQNILQERHPGLYWYASRNEMDSAFAEGRRLLKDSLTESGFRTILSKVITHVQCGHTTVLPSKAYTKFDKGLQSETSFPLSIKTWSDTIIAASNLKNTELKRGDRIIAVNGRNVPLLLDTIMKFIPADGNNIVAKSQLLSNAKYFGDLFKAVYGSQDKWDLQFVDSIGNTKQAAMLIPKPSKPEISKKEAKPKVKKEKKSKAERLKVYRSLEKYDTARYAVMQINSFSGPSHLKSFFKKSFKQLNKKGIPNLIIDLRLNGGGSLSNATALSRYLAAKPFRICDSVYAITSHSKYSRYIKNDFFIKVYISLITHCKKGKLRFTYFENKVFKPFKHKGFRGNVYILTGGYTYSASTLFLNVMKGQSNITIVGEPTGGAAYGTNAMLIPDVTLPNTKVRFRLPLFRIVLNRKAPHNGEGILPDVFRGPLQEDIKNRVDYKMAKALELIHQRIEE